MSDWLLFDPLFRNAFLTGLLLAAALSLIGAWLRLRNEWLAAFGLSQIAAAGGIASLPLGLPVIFTASVAAGTAAAIKGLLPRAGNSHYALMIVLGWSAALILAGNVQHGHVIGETLLRGQLYFSSSGHLAGALLLLATVLATLRWLSPHLLRERFFPDWYSANRLPAWRHRLLFGALVVFAAVLGTLAMGAFPAFAMLFLPAWSALALARAWRAALILSIVIGTTAYVVAFVAAITLDQPFGPVLAFCLALTSVLRYGATHRAQRFIGSKFFHH